MGAEFECPLPQEEEISNISITFFPRKDLRMTIQVLSSSQSKISDFNTQRSN